MSIIKRKLTHEQAEDEYRLVMKNIKFDTWEELAQFLGLFDIVDQCDWYCPICNKKCGGIKGHTGQHQCPIHYKSQSQM
jgi:hypothetical protein